MEELIKAVESISEKNWIDYGLIFVPILISILAVVISVLTAKKQNKIALFEIKYGVISQIRLIKAFSNCLKDSINSITILSAFDSCFEMNLLQEYEQSKQTNQQNKQDIIIKINNRLKALQNNMLTVEFFLKAYKREDTAKLMIQLRKIVVSALDENIDDEIIKDFKMLSDDFMKKYLEPMVESVKI